MDQNNGSRNDDYGAQPPPYKLQDNVQSPYPGMSYQVGKGNIAVVSPPSTYDNMVHPEGQVARGGLQFSEAPPDYYQDCQDDNCFSDAAIRRGFIRKVYLTLMIQLLVTVGIICAFLYWEALREWTLDNEWFSYTMMAAVMVLIVALSCCDNLRRQVPLNFIALGLFTIAEGLMLGSVAVYFEAEAVLWAVGATALVSFSLSLFAMQSRWDFTAANGCMWAFGWTLISLALLCGIMRSQYLYIVYACLGTLLFSIYMVMDTQLILGGKHRKYAVSPEEYVFAALSLYLDIITLFLLLLQLIGLCR
ncbi:protein lifeguard 1 [Lampris incognitus]|uniref:protein lifeguard 1 n=1 Tax=Lampris incognitus TaxID=2546036 RepID=UPI0024B499D8|nr:protein lifeguard 1 [Lampris incognitus]